MSSSLIRKSLTYLVGTAGTRLLGILLIPLYAFFVTPTELGEFDYIQTLGGLTSAVIFVASWESIIRFAMARHVDWELREVARATIAIGFGGSVVAVLAATLLSVVWPESAGVFFAAAGVAALTGFLYAWQYAARADGKPRLFVLSGLLNALVNIVGILVLVVFLRLGALGLLVSYALGMAVAIVVLESRLRLMKPWAWPSRALVNAILRFATPLMFDFLASFLILAFGRILITSVLGAAENGAFAFALKIGMTVGTIAHVLTMAALEETVMRAHTENVSAYLSTLVTGAWLLLMSGATLLVLAARVVYEFLGDTGYADSFYLVPTLALTSAFSAVGSIYGNSFQIGKKTSYLFYTTVVSTIITITGSIAMIGVLGPMGVAVSMAVGTAACLTLRRVLARRIIRFHERAVVLIPMALFVVMWVIVVVPVPDAPLLACGVAGAVAAGALAWRAVRMLQHIDPSTTSEQ